MDPLLLTRQMMAENKFTDAQTILESLLNGPRTESRPKLLAIYFEILEHQQKQLPPVLVFEHAKFLSQHSLDEAMDWLGKLKDSSRLHDQIEYHLLLMKAANAKGRIEELRRLMNNFQIFCIENSLPLIHAEVNGYAENFFKQDFQLKVQRLALHLMRADLDAARALTGELLHSAFERVSAKGSRERLSTLHAVLTMDEVGGELLIFRNFLALALQGVRSSKDYKSLAEIMIAFEEFELQVFLLDLLDRLGLSEVGQAYADEIRSHEQYSFVYLDKHFQHLKVYFHRPLTRSTPAPAAAEVPDLTLEARSREETLVGEMASEENLPEELQIARRLLYQDLTFQQTMDFAIGLLQAEMPRGALELLGPLMKQELSAEDHLKAAYLRMMAFLAVKDYRAALDLAFESLPKARSKDDVLSILYCEAEAYIQLEETESARRILKRILTLDADYRLARARLERLG